ncbi:MAG: hypothetical protein OXU96_12120, partial [Gammaproteobacteria bacterium]|nr:hypothetical protein [Gammaproteobacteria bacterium]
VPGDMKLNDFDNLANFGIDDPRMTTIGGVAFRHLDRLPREGDKVRVDDILIQVLEMDAHRIARVRVAQGVDDDDFERAGEVGAVHAPAAGEHGDADADGAAADAREQAPEDIDAAVPERAEAGSRRVKAEGA